MRNGRYLFLLTLLIICVSVYSQLRYPIVGTYKKKSAQGMAIYGDTAYLMHDGGLCRVLDLKSGKVARDFNFQSSSKDNHINNACFGKTFYKGSKVPLVYLSECMGRGRCFVECITPDSSILVQTIQATKKGKIQRMTNWVVDNDRNYLYAITRNRNLVLDSIGNIRGYITKYRLPSITEGNEIALSEKDELDKFEVLFPNILQGSKIRGNLLYLVTGLAQSQSYRKDAKRAILVLDLKKKDIIRSIDLTYVSVNEPEDIDFYGNYALLYCGHEGGIYKIDIK